MEPGLVPAPGYCGSSGRGKHREEKRADLMPIDLAAAVVGWLAGSDFR